MRLFFAAMLPEVVQARLGKLRAGLDWIPAKPTWTATPNLHITLKFLGDVEDAKVNEVALAAREAIPKTGALTLRPSHLVYFPEAGSARVLGVGFSGETARLIGIQLAIESTCAELGFRREGRAYTPHATLARFRAGLRPTHRPRIEDCCSSVAEMPEFVLDAVQLMQSTLTPRGSEYAVAATFPLTAQEAK